MNQEIQNNFIVEPFKADLIMGKIVDENIKKQLDKSMDFFLKYYPARIKNVGEDAIAARELVWAFKDARDNAFEKVAEMTAEHLKKEYGDKLRNMSFVCVPTSNKDHYATRFSAFCKRVSELSGVENGFSHIVIMQSRMAVHEHRHGKKKCEVKPQLIDFDVRYFKGKDVCVFDDVVTTGKSYANFANMLEDNGANVVGGMFLGKTFYKYNQN